MSRVKPELEKAGFNVEAFETMSKRIIEFDRSAFYMWLCQLQRDLSEFKINQIQRMLKAQIDELSTEAIKERDRTEG